MAEVKFYLRDKSAQNKTSIIAILNYSGKRLKLTTGLTIDPKFWNDRRQQSKIMMDFPLAQDLNDQLEDIEKRILEVYRAYRKRGEYPSFKSFREEVFQSGEANPLMSLKFWNLFEKFIEEKRISNRDIKNYENSLRKQLINGERVYGAPMSFAILKERGEGFVTKWDEYLTFEAPNADGEPGMSINTIGKLHKDLKAFLNWCFDNNYTESFSLKHLPTTTVDMEKVYLTEEELVRIEKLDLKEQEGVVRDLFLIGCETGMRFSDFTSLSEVNLKGDTLLYEPKKTGGRLVIPISVRLKGVLDKYKPQIPRFDASVSEFNSTLRSICEKAEISETIMFETKRQNTMHTISKLKFEMVSSHTARRTFCTLKFLKGMPAQAIMKFSGHKTERSFLKYLRLDAEVTAEKFKGYF